MKIPRHVYCVQTQYSCLCTVCRHCVKTQYSCLCHGTVYSVHSTQKWILCLYTVSVHSTQTWILCLYTVPVYGVLLPLTNTQHHYIEHLHSLCAAYRTWVRHWSVVIVPLEGGLEFRWDSEMYLCFIHVTSKLVSGTTRRSVIESCITHVSSSPRETVRGTRLRWGFSPRAAARPLERTRVTGDPAKRGVWIQTSKSWEPLGRRSA